MRVHASVGLAIAMLTGVAVGADGPHASADPPCRAGRVEGRLMFGDRPASRVKVMMHGPDARAEDGGGNTHVTRETRTDAEGRFAFEAIPAGKAKVGQVFETDDGGWHNFEAASLPVEVRPGVTTAVTMGGLGRPVVGTVVAPRGDDRFEPVSVRVRIFPSAPPISGPSDVAAKTWAAYGSWLSSPAGRHREQSGVAPDAQGKVRFERVPAGSYHVQVYVPADLVKRGPKDSIPLRTRRFDVPPMPDGRLEEPLVLDSMH